MTDAIGVLNAGSSSIKFSLFAVQGDDLDLEVGGQIEGIDTAPHFISKDRHGATVSETRWPEGTRLGHDGALDHLFAYLRGELAHLRLVAVGHRVAHGGLDYAGPVRIDAETLEHLTKLIPLVPLHQPHNLAPIRFLRGRAPELLQVACFDTSFHRGNAEITQMFGLPSAFHEAGVRRYGFHGLSYEYIASVLPQYDAQAAAGRCIVLHLGNGSSMCALDAGRSVASTMGFTGLDGLVMGTRCGNLDPGVLLFLMDQRGMDARTIERLIYTQSGLLGVSGISGDMRILLASEDPRARRAVDLYLYRIRREMGSLAAALGGLDAIVFTGGIGEHAAPIRAGVCRDAGWLGVVLDPDANARGGPRISTATARVQAWVIPTNEELMIARHTRRMLSSIN
jgi:acetate kinase